MEKSVSNKQWPDVAPHAKDYKLLILFILQFYTRVPVVVRVLGCGGCTPNLQSLCRMKAEFSESLVFPSSHVQRRGRLEENRVE